MYSGVYIICAAIWYDDGIVHKSQPSNIGYGYVISGRRHHDCKELHRILVGSDTIVDDVRGFITSDNKFQDREEALVTAVKARQVIFGQTKNPHELHSTDLY